MMQVGLMPRNYGTDQNMAPKIMTVVTSKTISTSNYPCNDTIAIFRSHSMLFTICSMVFYLR